MVDVSSFGAKGDGQTDDTAAFQAADKAAGRPSTRGVATRFLLPEVNAQNVWNRLAIFESRDLVRDRFQVRQQRELASQKAEEIVSHLAQGRAFFSSAEGAQESVRPLLQYYGVLSWARGFILYLSTTLREAGLSSSHGLSAVSWGQTLADGTRNVGKLGVRLDSGTFSQLLDATQNLERTSIFAPPIPNRTMWRKAEPRPVQGTVISALDLLSRIPDLCNEFESTLSSPSSCNKAFVFTLSEVTQTDINIFPGLLGLPDAESLRTQFGIPTACEMRLVDRHNFVGEIRNCFVRLIHKNVNEMAAQMPMLANDSHGESFIIAPFAGGTQLSSLVKFFALSYFLGMLARYFPTRWIAMSNRQTGDRLFPLLRAGSDLVQQRFPIAVLRELEAPPQ
jgi:hypothetical protein